MNNKSHINLKIILKNFDKPDVTRNFEKGKFEIISIGGMTIGKATYKPGWKWSKHVSPLSGTKFCEVEHLGMVLSGSATAAFEKGDIHTMNKGDLFIFHLNHMIVGLWVRTTIFHCILLERIDTQTELFNYD